MNSHDVKDILCLIVVLYNPRDLLLFIGYSWSVSGGCEAAQENCPIVVTSERFCPVKTYFPNCPYVVNPLDIDNIKNTVLTAYIEKKKNNY